VKGVESSIVAALVLISKFLLDAANQRKQTDPAGPGEPETQYTFKLLIHKFLAGSIIGKAGAIIKEIQEQTKCRLQLSNEPLSGSTEKTVSVHGTPDVLQAALTRIMNQLATNQLRAGSATILYVPGMAVPGAFGGPPPFGAPPPAAAGYPNPYGAPPPAQYVPQHQYGAPQGYGAPQAYGAPPPVSSGAQKTEKIVIPTVCAGTVLGKGGSIIRDIKTQSGTSITIADPEPTALEDRVVSVTGTPQGIQTAIYLIRQRVESYRPPTVPGSAPASY
jgi:polyribonucleotide nucleotidyltransferase